MGNPSINCVHSCNSSNLIVINKKRLGFILAFDILDDDDYDDDKDDGDDDDDE